MASACPDHWNKVPESLVSGQGVAHLILSVIPGGCGTTWPSHFVGPRLAANPSFVVKRSQHVASIIPQALPKHKHGFGSDS